MMDGPPQYLIEMAEEKFAEVGYTAEDYEIDTARYGSTKSQDTPVFNVSVIYELKDDGLELAYLLVMLNTSKSILSLKSDHFLTSVPEEKVMKDLYLYRKAPGYY